MGAPAAAMVAADGRDATAKEPPMIGAAAARSPPPPPSSERALLSLDALPRGIPVSYVPLYGAQGDGPAVCGLLRVGGATILLDCGWDDRLDPALLAPLLLGVGDGAAAASAHHPLIAAVDAVLLSHATPAHSGALPYLVGRRGMRAPVLCTLPTARMAALAAYDTLLSRQASDPSFALYGADDVDAAFARRAACVKFRQAVAVPGAAARALRLTATAHPAGHTLGGAVWRLTVGAAGGEEVVYAPRANHRDERLLDGCALAALCSRPALLVADAFHALQPPAPERGRRDAALVDACLSVLRSDGSVLIPTDASGRALELLAALDAAWGERRLAGAYGLAFVSPVAASTVEFSRCLVEYASEGVRRAFERDRVNHLRPRHARLVASPGALAAAMAAAGPGAGAGAGADDGADDDGGRHRRSGGGNSKTAPPAKRPGSASTSTSANKPMVVIASGGAGLEAGAARELLLSRWASDPRSAVLFASRPPEGSLGARLLAERAAPAGSRLKPPLPCRVAVWRREELVGEELAEHERARARRRAERRAAREAAARSGAAAAAAAAAQRAQADAVALAAAADAAAVDAAAAAAAADAAGGPRTPHGGARGLMLSLSSSSAAASAALVDGFAPPEGAAHAMFPDDDEALCAQWDAYGEVLDMDALRRAAELSGAEGAAGLGGGLGGGGEAGAGAIGVGGGGADGRRGGGPGGGRGGPAAMSAAAQALARMAAIIGEDDGGGDDDEDDDDDESDEDDDDSDMEEEEDDDEDEDGGGGGGARRQSKRGSRRPSSAAAAKRKQRRRLAAGASATLAAAAAAMAAADKGGGHAPFSSSSSEDEDEDEEEQDGGAGTKVKRDGGRAGADRGPAPTKAVLREVDVPVAARVLPYADYDGASDGRSLSAVLAQCGARCLALAGGSRDATAALAFACLGEGQGRSSGGRVATPGPGEAVELALAPAYRVRVGAGVVARPAAAGEDEEGGGGEDDDDQGGGGGGARPGGKLHAIGGYSLAWISGTLKALRVDPAAAKEEEEAREAKEEQEDEGSERGGEGGGAGGKEEEEEEEDAAMADVKAEEEGGANEAGVNKAAEDAADEAKPPQQQQQQPPKAAPPAQGLASAAPLLPWPPARLALVSAGAGAAASAAAAAQHPHSGGGGEGSVFIGDVRLSELRQALAAAGVASEFRAAPSGGGGGGALACAGGVTVRRAAGGGELIVEGPLCDAYFSVRDVLYAQYSVC